MPKVKKTQTNSMKAQIANIKREINPLVKVRPLRGNPKPINTGNTTFVAKTIQIVKTAASNTANLAVNDITGKLTNTSDIRIDFVKVWNSAPASSLRATLVTGKVISSKYPADIIGEDFGHYSSLAGIKFDIPMTLTSDITENGQTDNLVTATTGGATDSVIYQVGVRFAV